MTRKLALFTVVFCWLTCLTGVSWAQSMRKLTIELGVPAASAPSHVCMITNTRAPRPGQHAELRALVGNLCEKKDGSYVCNATSTPTSTPTLDCSKPPKDACASGDTGSSACECIERKKKPSDAEQAWSKRCCNSVGAALDALDNPIRYAEDPRQPTRVDKKGAPVPGSATCSDRSFDFPAKKLSDGLLFCAPNESPGGEERVLVLNLHAPYSAMPAIHGIEVNGTAVVVSVQESQEKTMTLEVGVSGGDFLKTAPFFVAGNTLHLQLAPRCAVHSISVAGGRLAGESSPPSQAEPGQADQAGGAPKPKPKQKLTFKTPAGKFVYSLEGLPSEVLLPYSLKPGQRKLVLTAESSVFELAWDEVAPKAQLRLLAKTVQLSWERHCAFPRGETKCPELSLPDVAVKCKDGVPAGESCQYTCASESSSDPGFGFPQRVSFRQTYQDDFVEHWEGQTFRDGDVLKVYTPASGRHVRIEIGTPGESAMKETNTQRIDYLEVRGPAGKRFRVKPETGGVRLHIPGVGCNDFLSFRYVGRRSYHEKTVQLKQGVALVPEPHTLEQSPLSVALTANVGLSYGPLGFAGDQEFGVPFGLEAYMAYRWSEPRSACCDGAGLSIGVYRLQHPYRARVASGGSATLEPVTEHGPLVVVPVEFGALKDLWHSTTVSLHAGLAVAFSQSSSQAELLPTQLSPTASFQIVHYPTRLPIALEVGLRWLPATTVNAKSTFLGNGPTLREDTVYYILPMLGLRVGG